MDVAEVGGVNAFDAGFAALVLVLSLVGLLKGLTRLVVGMTALVAAFLLAAARHAQVGAALVAGFEMPPLVAGAIGYGVVFLGVMLLAALILPLLRAVVRTAMLAWADRLAGAAAGLAGAVLIGGSVVVPVLAYAPTGERLLAESQLAPYAVVGRRGGRARAGGGDHLVPGADGCGEAVLARSRGDVAYAAASGSRAGAAAGPAAAGASLVMVGSVFPHRRVL